MAKYVMALDGGTTSNRCILFDKDGNKSSVAQKEFPQIYPVPGWVEHDPEQLWETMHTVAREAMEKVGAKPEDIAGIGITNQRETTIVWDKNTGKPVYNAIVWQCRRTTEYCQTLKDKGLEEKFRAKTGLIVDPYFSGTKLRWILENVEGVKEKAEKGDLLFGTVDTWFLWNLTGGAVHATDYSNASRTYMFNIHDLKWDEEILAEFGVPASMLPEVKPSSGLFGYTAPEVLGGAIPVCGIAGDQQAALFGQACFDKGDLKCTYGTGGFLLMNTGETPVLSNNGLLTTIAWGLDGKVIYALEGSVFVAGASIQWLRDEMKLVPTSPESEAIALQVPDSGGCYVVPAFTGLGAPYWKPDARGMIVGVTRGTGNSHIVRATLEAIAYQMEDVIAAMAEDAGVKIEEMLVDGGASGNNFLMQFQSDLIDGRVLRPENVETTGLGAAFLAGLHAGFWTSPEEIAKMRKIDRTFDPALDEAKRTELLDGWHRAVRASIAYSEDK